MTCPSGRSEGAIQAMQEKSLDWATTVKDSKLSRRNVWFMMEKQFWPHVAFGLCVNLASYKSLSECLMKPYHKIQSQGSIRNSVQRGLRQLHPGFYGVGCPHPAIECFIAQLNKLLLHLGTKSSLGITMQALIELLTIELGISDQPFLENYNNCNKWVTHSWLKRIWEKAYQLKVKIELGSMAIQPPRGPNDFWLMKEVTRFCSADEVKRINRVRLHQQVIFYSDVMDAGGRNFDKKYLSERPPL